MATRWAGEQSLTTDAGTDLALSAPITIETSGSYEDADGTTNEWSNTTEIGADIDLSVVAQAVTVLADDATSEDRSGGPKLTRGPVCPPSHETGD